MSPEARDLLAILAYAASRTIGSTMVVITDGDSECDLDVADTLAAIAQITKALDSLEELS